MSVVTVVVVSAIVFAAALAALLAWPRLRASLEEQRVAEVTARLADCREYFERAVLRSEFAAGAGTAARLQEPIARTRAEFDRLEARVAAGDLDGVEESAQALARMRAYVWPVEEARQEGPDLLAAMRQWGIPAAVLVELEGQVEQMRRAPEPESRALLYQLYADHDFWSPYVDWLIGYRRNATLAAAGVTILAAALAYLALLGSHLLWGTALAAAAGAALSVMRRPPPVDVFSKVADFFTRAARRVFSGVLGALLALGLVQAGIIVIPLPRGTDLTTVLGACALDCGWARATVLFTFGATLGFSERLLSTIGESMLPSTSRGSSAERAAVRAQPGAT